MDDVSKLIKELKSGFWIFGGSRAEAAAALGKIGDARAVAPLCNCLKSTRDHKDWYTLTNYARALGDLGDARAVRPLCKLLNRKLPLYDTVSAYHVQIAIIEALAKIGDPRANEALNQFLEKEFIFSTTKLHEKATEALGIIGGAGSSERIVGLALDRGTEPSVRLSAVVSLGKIGDKGAVEGIIAMLEECRWDSDTYTKAEEALQNITDTEGMEALFKTAGEEPDQITGSIVAKALGMIGDVRAVEPLCEWLKRGGKHVNLEAAISLGKIGDIRAFEPLCESLDHIDSIVRWKAAEALGQIGDARAIEPIIRAFVGGDSGCKVGLDYFQPLDVGSKFESLGLLREADDWYTQKGLFDESAAVRKIIAEMSGAKVSQKVVQGDENVTIRDSLVMDSTVGGAGSSNLMEQLKELAQMKTEGMLTEDEFNQAKRKLLQE